MVLYWDASAVLSVLIQDEHSRTALKYAKKRGVHLMSTLCFSEVNAVIHRMKREDILTNILYESLLEVLQTGPWRRIAIQPEWGIIQGMSIKYSLRGADLWHIAAAKTLQRELPEVKVLTFDKRMAVAAKREHFFTKEKINT